MRGGVCPPHTHTHPFLTHLQRCNFPHHSSGSCSPVSFKHFSLFSLPPPLLILLSSPHLGSISCGADTHGSDRQEAVWRHAKCASGKFYPQLKTASPKARPQHSCHLAQLGVWTEGCGARAVPGER